MSNESAPRWDRGGTFNERSNGLRHRRSVVFLAVALAALGAGCGDDDPPPPQTAFWMGFAQTNTPQRFCPTANQYNVPDSARTTIIGGGQGERREDGQDGARVECSITQGSGLFNVSITLSAGAIGSFSARGTATPGTQGTPGTGTLSIDFNTRDFALSQDACTATIDQVLPGALWVKALSCSGLEDPSSPSTLCAGNGGFIVENCSR